VQPEEGLAQERCGVAQSPELALERRDFGGRLKRGRPRAAPPPCHEMLVGALTRRARAVPPPPPQRSSAEALGGLHSSGNPAARHDERLLRAYAPSAELLRAGRHSDRALLRGCRRQASANPSPLKLASPCPRVASGLRHAKRRVGKRARGHARVRAAVRMS